MRSMQNIQISQHHVNPGALEVCRVLSQDGYQAFIVGGCVRDLLLGHVPKDWDITTDATPQEVMALFSKTIPTGLQHGTVTVVLGEGVENHFEVTTFRIEGDYTDGRRPEQVFFVMNVEQDLARRDLTINAIAYDPIADRLVDPFGGIQDLELGIIKAVGSPDARFQEDGLRIMRVARFAARFGYAVHLDTLEGMKNSIDTLKKVSKERLADELCKTLMTTNPALGLQLLKDCGALQVACPKLCSSPPLSHFISRQNRVQGELETRLAFMYGNCDTALAQQDLLYLKLSNREIKKVVFLLQLLDRFGEFMKKDTELAYKSFMAVIKNCSPDPWEHTLSQFIELTEAMGLPARVLFGKYQQVVVLMRKELQLNGDDLLRIGIEPGPQIKKILDNCYLEVLRNPEHNNREFLFDFAADQYNVMP
jgi:tRNA nucleotidyltransferase (CCA-adding enzyme)